MKRLVAFAFATAVLCAGLAPAAQAQEPMLGEVRYFGFNFCPRGWADANGSLLPISNNTALFSLLGTTYGGDGRTTFALPDLGGRVPLHAGTGPGLTQRREGQRGGAERVALTVGELPAHSHILTVRALAERATQADPSGAMLARSGSYRQTGTPVNLGSGAGTIGNTGSSQAHENMPPFVVLRACIATQGIFPSRN